MDSTKQKPLKLKPLNVLKRSESLQKLKKIKPLHNSSHKQNRTRRLPNKLCNSHSCVTLEPISKRPPITGLNLRTFKTLTKPDVLSGKTSLSNVSSLSENNSTGIVGQLTENILYVPDILQQKLINDEKINTNIILLGQIMKSFNDKNINDAKDFIIKLLEKKTRYYLKIEENRPPSNEQNKLTEALKTKPQMLKLIKTAKKYKRMKNKNKTMKNTKTNETPSKTKSYEINGKSNEIKIMGNNENDNDDNDDNLSNVISENNSNIIEQLSYADEYLDDNDFEKEAKDFNRLFNKDFVELNSGLIRLGLKKKKDLKFLRKLNKNKMNKNENDTETQQKKINKATKFYLDIFTDMLNFIFTVEIINENIIKKCNYFYFIKSFLGVKNNIEKLVNAKNPENPDNRMFMVFFMGLDATYELLFV